MSYVLVAVGGAIGASLRHGVNRAFVHQLGLSPVFGTLFVNILGSFLMGLLAGALLARDGTGESWRFFLGTGVLGGFTTFSAFSLQAVLMWEHGDHAALALYVIASVGLSILALVLGLASVRMIV